MDIIQLTGQSFALNAEMKAAFDVWQAAVVEYNADPSNTSKRQAVIDTGKQYRTLTSEWVSGNGAVSVGNSADSMTRQIINVAAGSQDTDAVNLAQLKAVNTKVDDNKISYVSINTKKTANKNNDQAGVPMISRAGMRRSSVRIILLPVSVTGILLSPASAIR